MAVNLAEVVASSTRNVKQNVFMVRMIMCYKAYAVISKIFEQELSGVYWHSLKTISVSCHRIDHYQQVSYLAASVTLLANIFGSIYLMNCAKANINHVSLLKIFYHKLFYYDLEVIWLEVGFKYLLLDIELGFELKAKESNLAWIWDEIWLDYKWNLNIYSKSNYFLN